MFLTGQLFGNRANSLNILNRPKPTTSIRPRIIPKKNTSRADSEPKYTLDNVTVKSQATHFSIRNSGNIWNNPALASRKIANFYHNNEQSFKRNSVSDRDMDLIQRSHQDFTRSQSLMLTKQESNRRTTARKMERQAL